MTGVVSNWNQVNNSTNGTYGISKTNSRELLYKI